MRHLVCPHLAILLTLAATSVRSQTYTISTLAGGGLPVNISGLSASLDVPLYALASDSAGNLYFTYHEGLATDSAGNLYVTDQLVGCVRKLSNGQLTTVAGNGTQGISGDNAPATNAQLANPVAVAVDTSGNLYIADYGSQSIRKVS